MRNFHIVAFFLLLVSAPYLAFATGRKIKKIVIDAGHGGHDGGARGQFSNEKDLTLAVALRLGKMMADSMKDVQIIYTRTTDVFIPLAERHEIANRANADVFISIHVNSTAGTTTRIKTGTKRVKRGRKYVTVPVYRTTHNRSTAATGVETFVLGLSRNNQKSNAIGEYSENMSAETGLMNENDPQTAIIIANYTAAFLTRSVTLGSYIQEAFAAQGRVDKGVKQMSLEVLAGSAMPGVLVEIGFINNPTEEVYLNSEKGQKEVANAIFRGIRTYKGTQ